MIRLLQMEVSTPVSWSIIRQTADPRYPFLSLTRTLTRTHRQIRNRWTSDSRQAVESKLDEDIKAELDAEVNLKSEN